MKRLLVSLILVLPLRAIHAQSITIRIDRVVSNVEWVVNGIVFTRAQLQEVLPKLATLDSDQAVQIVPNTTAMASDLAETVGMIQKSGLHDLILLSPRADDVTNGAWRITLDAKRRALPVGCIDSKEQSGFYLGDYSWLLTQQPRGKYTARAPLVASPPKELPINNK